MGVILSVHSKSPEYLDDHPKQRASVRRLAKMAPHNSRPVRQEMAPFTPIAEKISVGKFTYWIKERERQKPYQALSAQGLFQHYYIDPLCFWKGENDRTLLSQTLASVEVQDKYGTSQVLINSGSHNCLVYINQYPNPRSSSGCPWTTLHSLI
jgi:hypothetical protein